MPTDVDQQIARTNEFLNRTSERYSSLGQRRRQRQGTEIKKRLGRIVGVDLSIVVAAIVVGWFLPIGMAGAMLVAALLIASTLGLAVFPLTGEVKPETLNQTPLKLLPMRTEQWLETQRSALPAPAARILDDIGTRLETLSPQLATLNDQEPAAAEIRKLIGEQLPELVKGYARVPAPLRTVERNGRTADDQLTDGLKLISDEIAEMSANLAQGDLDSLATRGRFLEIKYRDDQGIQ
ncbi:hypothetical protein BH09PSE4_BH09PSE4_11980 [soil metagenome]